MRNCVRTAVARLAAVAVFAFATSAFAADKDVVVVNTPAQPVPTTVQGTVQTNVQGTVQTAVQGTVQTSIVGTVSVQDVDHPARQPFADIKAISFDDGEAQDFTEFDPVPAGKRLVIETVTLRAQAAAGQIWDVTMFVTTNGITIAHTLQLSTFQTLGDIDIRTATLPVRFYADPGTQVKVHAHREYGTVGFAGVNITVSGHHVSVP
jgi:hypothetical protein